MKKFIAIAALILSPTCMGVQPSKAKADYSCGPTICSMQWFCGNASLHASQQHCAFPIRAKFCETRTCSYAGTYMVWTWWL